VTGAPHVAGAGGPAPAALDTALAAVLAARAADLAPPGSSHLCAAGPGAGPYALNHAVKIRPGTGSAAAIRLLARVTGAGEVAGPVIHWLVWLGTAIPPAPPSHVRVAVTDPEGHPGALARLARAAGIPATGTPTAGLLLPLSDGPALRVTPDERGAQVLGPAGPLWREEQVHDGRRLADPQLRLLGLVAEPHHRQVLPGIPTRQRLALLVCPEVTV
jgi:hypothetical protein